MKSKLIKQGDNEYAIYAQDKQDDTITWLANTNGIYVEHKLSVANCREVEFGYDLDALAKESSESQYLFSDLACYETGFIKGFKKAIEMIGEKNYTESDLKRAYWKGEEDSYLKGGLTIVKEYEYIKSLREHEWDVEIEMELNLNGKNAIERSQYKPKLDADGFLILKRI